MAERRVKKAPSRNEKTRDHRTAARFLEEFSWLLQSYSNLDFRVLSEDVRFVSPVAKTLTKTASKNGNIHFLVGTLPIIFNDLRYFPNNEDIVEFANGALGLDIGRWEKRSRYELIGLIVCETAKLNDHRLGLLVDALSRVTADDPGAQAIMVERKANSLSWNELIQRLTSQGGS